MTPKPKRGRPRKYDHVTVTTRYKLPVGTFDGIDDLHLKTTVAGVSVEAAGVSVEVNGKRVRWPR